MPKDKNARHLRRVRQIRVRKKVSGTPERPRLSVFRSLKHIYAQVIDDTTGRTIAAASSQESLNNGASAGSSTKTDVSETVGKTLAERALAAGVSQVVFDRGGCKYHGRVKALADGSREGGLKF
jgi:large subunit ribosomal protein L18